MKRYHPPHIAASIALILLSILPGRSAAFEPPEGRALPTAPAQQAPLLASYPIGGAALHVAVENGNSIWYTLPSQNAIGHLALAPDGSAVTQTLPVTGSHPYDIVFGAGAVWFTEEGSGQIGRINPANGSLLEFLIPVSPTLARPHGIRVAGSSPAQVWFTESGTDRIGLLTYDAATQDYSIREYPLPAGPDGRNGVDWSHSHPEGLVVRSANDIWFTAPDAATPLIAQLQPSLYDPIHPEYAFAAGRLKSGSRPWRLVAGTGQDFWMVDRGQHSIYHFTPSTIAQGFPFYTPTRNSDPQDLVLVGGTYAFIAETAAGRIGQTFSLPQPTRFFELPLEGSAPVGLAADNGTGCVWAADAAQPRLLRWCPPYFDLSRRAYLPSVPRSGPF